VEIMILNSDVKICISHVCSFSYSILFYFDLVEVKLTRSVCDEVSKQALLVAPILHYTQTLSTVSPQSWKHSSIWNTDTSENSAIVYIC